MWTKRARRKPPRGLSKGKGLFMGELDYHFEYCLKYDLRNSSSAFNYKFLFFPHLTVSWALPLVRIIFLKRCYACNYFMRFRRRVSSQIQSGGF